MNTALPSPVLPGAVLPSAVAIRLAGLVPPDSHTVFELCRPGSSVAKRARLRNPGIRFAVLPVPDGQLPPTDLSAILGPAKPQFDCAVFHDTLLPLPSAFAMAGALVPYLHPGASVLFVLPRESCEHLRADSGRTSVMEAIQTILAEIGLLAAQGFMVFADEARGTGDFSHLIIQATPVNGFRRLYVSAMTLRPAGACNDTRIDLPNAFLATVPGVRTQSAVDQLRSFEQLLGEQRVAILQRRIYGPHNLPGLKAILQQGYLLVAEFDDHPNHWPAMREFDHLTFRAAHAVQTSTEFLAEELRRFNPELAVFPNQIATLSPPRAARTDGRVALFFGAFNRGGDWESLMAPLNRILAANQGKVGVQVVHDRAFFDALETDNKAFLPTCGYDGYIEALRRCDIGLLPLNDTLFNRSKSDLKYIECAAHGVAALASPVVYGETVRDGDTGVLFRSPNEFADRLSRLIADVNWRTGIANRAYRYVRDHRLMAQHFRKRLEWYHSLLDRKDELDALLYERVPSLRP